MSKRVKIIWNPISGSGIGQRVLPKMREILEKRGFEVEELRTGKKGDARAAAAAVHPDFHSVVCIGGDGTLNETVNGLGSKGVPLAIFPAGTGNVFWHDIRTPRAVPAFCEMVMERKIKQFDVGEVGGRRFLCMAGAGFDACVVGYMENMRWGNMVMAMYAFPLALSMMNYDFPKITVTVDGKAVSRTAGSVIVGNIPTYGGPINFTTKAVSHDGLLDVLIFERVGIPNALKLAAKTALKKHTSDRDVKYVHGKRIRLESRRKVPIQVDGDSLGHLPADITVHEKDLPVIVDWKK
jgi:YegS/Rv2252/BmrU family lipid kinase